ncbi:MAG TPA: GrpB family protein [Pyrinomonadaceae bacterium]|jgi:GrpB-like predicted nucleotidyltransferase (UPF0157 family)
MIGLERGIVRLAPYTDEWRRSFESEKRLLETAIGRRALGIEHVGSTSVEGLEAKPIIDVAVAVRRLSDGEECVGALRQVGYEYKGENGLPTQRFFVKGEPRRTHCLHVVEIDGDEWRNYLLFRDYLRHNRDVMEAYAQLKRDLAQQYATNRGAYTEAKAAFIARVIASAQEVERRGGGG